MSTGRRCSQITPHPFVPKGGELKRKVTIAVAIAMLVGAGAAYAFLNTYTANFAFSGKAGSKSAPVAIGYKESYSAASSTPGNRAAVLTKIVTKVYGLTTDGKAFPKCSLAMISKSPKFDGNCPKGSLIASGRVQSKLGDHSLTGPGAPCNPYLHVYNGGQNVQNFFFYTKTGTDCLGLKTGASAPWQGRIKISGAYAVETVPLPPDISTNAGNTGLYGSLINEVLTYANVTTKVHGKTVGYNQSIGCKKHQRPWSISFTAQNGTGTSDTRTVSASAKC
jgi:hypothetical protein